ncbi:hypothetical protein J6590_006618 [Homalodisca vitripennis]|nr:hypothetical protein J6590_006618 [Homalodisca vitripennis]
MVLLRLFERFTTVEKIPNTISELSYLETTLSRLIHRTFPRTEAEHVDSTNGFIIHLHLNSEVSQGIPTPVTRLFTWTQERVLIPTHSKWSWFTKTMTPTNSTRITYLTFEIIGKNLHLFNTFLFTTPDPETLCNAKPWVNGLKVPSEPPATAGQASCSQRQDRSAVTHPSSSHAQFIHYPPIQRYITETYVCGAL